MPNKIMPKSDGIGYQDMRYGRPEDQARRMAQEKSGRRITSDDKRQGFTCMACLDGRHSKCSPWEGQRTCPCNICGGSHNRKDMIARRADRQVKRTKPTPRPHSRTQGAKPGPKAMSEAEKDEIVLTVGKVVASLAEYRWTTTI